MKIPIPIHLWRKGPNPHCTTNHLSRKGPDPQNFDSEFWCLTFFHYCIVLSVQGWGRRGGNSWHRLCLLLRNGASQVLHPTEPDPSPVLRIHDILVWIRVSMPLTNWSGFGSCYFRHWHSRHQQKTNLKKGFLLKVHLHLFSKIKSQKEVPKQ